MKNATLEQVHSASNYILAMSVKNDYPAYYAMPLVLMMELHTLVYLYSKGK